MELNLRMISCLESFEQLVENMSSLPWYREHGYLSTIKVYQEIDIPVVKQMYEDFSQKGCISKESKEKYFLKFKEFYQSTSGQKIFGHSNPHFEELISKMPCKDKIEKKFLEIEKKFLEMEQVFGFKKFSNYEVIFDPIGVNSKYTLAQGKSQIFIADAFGKTNAGTSLFNIMHEMVHLGIEEKIVQENNLNQEEKERLVDNICNWIIGFEKFWEIGEKASYLDKYIGRPPFKNLSKNLKRMKKEQSLICGFLNKQQTR